MIEKPTISPTRRGRPPKSSKTMQQRLNDLQHEEIEREISLVRGQPHRRGDVSTLAESPLGRFVRDYGLPRECVAAGQEYAELRKRWRVIWGAREDEKRDGSGGDVPMESMVKWRKLIDEWNSAMIDAGGRDGFSAVDRLAVDGLELRPSDVRLDAIAALTGLAKSMGRI